MAVPLALPRIAWGSPSSSRRALLVHGLGSSAALMWLLGDAPRARDYTVEAYAADLTAAHPSDGGTWDAVIGHSLGAAAGTVGVPTHVIAADPAVFSLFAGDLADEVLASNPLITMSVVEGAGHSVHRDRPEETVRQLMEALS